jgi:hypothetical protein
VSTSFDRKVFWFQPVLSWSPTLFTRINARLGSSFRSYDLPVSDEENSTDERTRFDHLWAGSWKPGRDFSGCCGQGIYGDLSAPADNISLMGSAEYYVNNKLSLTARAGVDQYKFQFETHGGNGSTFPPIGGPVTGDGTVIV